MCVKTEGLKLIPQAVLVLWKWEWQDGDGDVDHISEPSCEDVGNEHHNSHLQSDSSDSESSSETESAMFQLPALTHIVTFKCIGSTHSLDSQETLKQVSKLLGEGNKVPSK